MNKKIYKIVAQFEAGTLPKEDWSHKSHIQVALYYILKSKNIYEATTKMVCGIIRYHALTNPKNGCVLSFHQTITFFWMYYLESYIQKRFPHWNYNGLDEESFIQSIDINLFNKDIIASFYSKEILFSDEAKITFVSPDKKTIKWDS